MTLRHFWMWSRCDSRNVSIGERDDNEVDRVSVEEFAARYLKFTQANRSKGHRQKLVERLKSKGYHEFVVMRSKWLKLA